MKFKQIVVVMLFCFWGNAHAMQDGGTYTGLLAQSSFGAGHENDDIFSPDECGDVCKGLQEEVCTCKWCCCLPLKCLCCAGSVLAALLQKKEVSDEDRKWHWEEVIIILHDN